MGHEAAFAELDAVVLDLLEAPERDAVMAHIAGCAVCRAELDARQATISDLAFAAPLATSSASRGRIRDRLTARATADRQPEKTPAPLVFHSPSHAPAPSALPRWSTWLAIAAGLVLVASTGFFAMTARDREAFRGDLTIERTRADVAAHRADSLAGILAMRDSVLSGLMGRDVSMMTLTSSAAKEPYARMFWDRARNRWTLIAHNMPELKPGRTYQLWLVTAKAKISAGTFATRNGDALVVAEYPLADPLTAIAVTEEPAGGVPQPTGSVVIAAANTK
ncbi:MAG: anti-sigma factor domain-containing protein [Solirubrobacteraceae bacterium]